MKYAMTAIPIVLCVILIFIPIMELSGLVTGTEFKLYNEIATVIVQTVLCVGAVTALFIVRPRYGRTGRIFVILLLPISLLNALCFADPAWGWSILFVLMICGCSFAIYVRFASDSVGKAISAVVSVLAAVAFIALYVYNLVYTSFFSNITVEKTVGSPDGGYVAEVLTDESVLGDKTRVSVRPTDRCFGAIIGGFSKKPQLIYTGEDYEVDTVRISWANEKTIVINGTEYEISFD